ncbi:hypothetical protein ACLB1T_14015 [Escherichia coli]
MTTGWKNFTRVFTDEGIQKPFLAIFVWTVVFSLITVFLTVAVRASFWRVWCSGKRCVAKRYIASC